MQINKSYVIIGAICAVVFGLSNAGLHPLSGSTGFTGSPVDSNCAQCHTGNNGSLDGEITIDGLPSTIETGETYTLSVTITNPNGNAAKAGFQLVALNGSNGNAGTMTSPSANTQIRVGGGRNYFGHAPAPNFPASNELYFSVDWTAPSTTGTVPEIKFYAAAVIANGANGNQMDRVRLTSMIIPIASSAMPLEIDITNIVPTACADSANGSATATATGGTPPYNYTWSNGINNATNTTLPAGLAFVTVTDNTGATNATSANIPSPPVIIANASGSVVCNGASNGTASVLASGGVGGFTYSWSTGQSGSNISGLTLGTYSVTITDINGCQETAMAEVTESPEISITGTENNVTCFGQSNGSIITNVFGGTPSFSYNWSNGSNQANILNVVANTYTVTVTDAANCTSSEVFSISQPTLLTATITSLTPVSCFGSADGSAQVTASGGTSPYNFEWSNGASGTGNNNTQNNLMAGNYVVTITDFYDCAVTQNIEITQPLQITTYSEKNNVSCHGNNDGYITLEVSNTVGNPTYVWSNGATTQNINNLSIGNYVVTITDVNGCMVSLNFNISQPDLLTVNTLMVDNVNCNGGSNGFISLNVAGGNGDNTYLWSNGSNFPQLASVPAGEYSVTVTDKKDCMATTSATISQPPAIQLSILSSTNATCLGAANGAISITTTNGIPPYNYAWSNGSTTAQLSNVTAGNYYITVSDANNCIVLDTFTIGTNASFNISLLSKANILCHGDSSGVASVTQNAAFTYLWSTGQTTATVTNLPAGLHSVVATNAGCQSTPLNVSITQPPLMRATVLAADSILCQGETNGYLSINLDGGVGTLTYQWSHGDSLLLTDSLKAGIYTITLTDDNECMVSDSFAIHLATPIQITNIDIDSVVCFGQANGGLALGTTGGFGALKFHWSEAGLLGDSIVNLNTGKYVVTISDQGNCTLVDSFQVSQPDELNALATINNETEAEAKDGSITLLPLGGNAPYLVQWSTGDSTLHIENLAPGLYTYVITDDKGCIYESWAIVSGGNCNLSATYTTKPSTCFNIPDGAIQLNITGNFSSYEVAIYKNNTLINKPNNALLPDTYSIIISDSSSCVAILSDIIVTSEHPAINLDSLIITKPSSSSSANGSIKAIVSGGEGALMYEWTKFGPVISKTESVENITTGIYQLKITDMAGCILNIDNIFVETASSVKDEISTKIIIVPNPIQNNFKIQSEYEISQIDIWDYSGKILYSDRPNQRILNLDSDIVNIVESGVYFCRIWIKNQAIIKKIVVLK